MSNSSDKFKIRPNDFLQDSDLGPNILERSSADDTGRQRVNFVGDEANVQ